MGHAPMSFADSPLAPRFPDALVVMVKAPVPGAVKTRLCPPAAPEEAADLYRAFVVDVARELRAWTAPCDRWIAWDGPGDTAPDALLDAVGDGFRWLRQRGEDLTARMEAVFDDLLGAGYRRVVMRNSDSPHLPVSTLDEALAAPGGGVVLGPDLDGGFYLVGLDVSPAGLFPRAMSHASVFEECRANAEALGHRVVLLPPFLDVDTPDDLLTFWVEFENRADVQRWATWAFLDGHPLIDRLRSAP